MRSKRNIIIMKHLSRLMMGLLSMQKL